MLRPFRGMYWDVRRRLPYYWSDITDGYKDVSSTSGAPRQNLTGESIEVWKVVSP
jgi:hypothetical protein